MASMMPGLVWRLRVAVVAVVLAACSTGGGSLAPSATLTLVSPPPTESAGSSSESPSAASPRASPQASSFASQTCSTTVATAGLTSDPLNLLAAVQVVKLPGHDRVTFTADKAWGGLQIVPASPPFTDRSGAVRPVAGASFYRITLDRVDSRALPATQLDQLVSGSVVQELARIGDTTNEETWIVGLAGPSCLNAGWLATPSGQQFIVDFATPLNLVPVSGAGCLATGWSGPVGPGQTAPPLAAVRDVQIGSASVDVRLSSLGGVSVKFSQAAPPFTRDPSGLPVVVAGTTFWKVVLTGVDGSGLPPAELDQARSGVIIRALREIGDFEGVQTWIIGYDGPFAGMCGRVYKAADQTTIEFRLAPEEGS